MSDTGFYNYTRYLQGDKPALNDLVCTYSDALTRYAYCYLHDAAAAEDVMEETFATLIVKRKKFKDEQHFLAYLYRVARNKSIDYLRRRGREVSLDDIEDIVSSNSTENTVLKQERNRTIYVCMQQLPAQYCDVLYLTYFDGFNTEEVCLIMKKNIKQVYNLLARAKAALKELLLKEGITHEDL